MLDRNSLQSALSFLGALLEQRVTTERFGGLTIHIASRYDQIHFKLYASVDQGPASKHFRDLKKLSPTPDEIRAAARWCATHDVSPEFKQMLDQAPASLGVGVG